MHCTRRTFLQAGTIAVGGAAVLAANNIARFDLEQRQFIFIWLRGGLSPLDSFDPKPQASSAIRGETTAIATAIPGIQFSEHFPRLAERAGKFCLVRSLMPGNDRHGVAEASLLSGTSPAHFESEASIVPSYAAWLASQFGPRGNQWPNFQIGTQLDSRYGGGGTGHLPFLTGPVVIPGSPECEASPSETFCFPGGVGFRRLQAICGARPSLNRFEAAWRLVSDRLQQLNSGVQSDLSSTTDRLIAAAHRWHVSSAARSVLDLTRESSATRAGYGESSLGDDCLLARRLIEAGVRSVTVTSGGWDHHAAIASEIRSRGPQLDMAIAGLLDDLDHRGLLARTTIACLSDFGRAPRLNLTGGRDHWPHTGVCLLAGAGIPKGTVIGRTDDNGEWVVDEALTSLSLRKVFLHNEDIQQAI